jgi:hypothetical protein
VLHSLLQAPVSLYLDTLSKLPPHSIHLFLHIAFMLMTTGQMQHDALSSILVLVFSLIFPDYKEWHSTMPSTTYFQSYQPTFIGIDSTHSLCLHATRPISGLLLSSRDCSERFVITKINRSTTCTFAFNSTVPKRHDAKLSLDCTPQAIESLSVLFRWGLCFG